METTSHSAFCPPAERGEHTAVAGYACATTLPVQARAWLTLAVGALVVAGLLSLMVVIGRIPGLRMFPSDPLFYKRCLVVHVVLALVVWFYAFVAGLTALAAKRKPTTLTTMMATAGMGLIVIGAFMPAAEPILANYLPVIDHPVFLTGMALFFAATLIELGRFAGCTVGQAGSELPQTAILGLRAAAVAVCIAAATWVAARAGLPETADRWMLFEFSAWGAGHVLQVANTCAMLAVWFWVLHEVGTTSSPRPGTVALLFGALLLPHLAAPLLTVNGSINHLYIHGSTQLMRWGIFPIVTVVAVIALRSLWLSRHIAKRSPRCRALTAGLLGSIGLTTLGFAIGAMIRESSTLIPAHYHASLGGISIAFMTAAYLIAARRNGIPATYWTTVRRQLVAFAIGQAIFAAGFAIGGMYGLSRKAYTSEQYIKGAGEYAGIAIMGIGGLIAAAAGIAFLCIILREAAHWWGLAGNSGN